MLSINCPFDSLENETRHAMRNDKTTFGWKKTERPTTISHPNCEKKIESTTFP